MTKLTPDSAFNYLMNLPSEELFDIFTFKGIALEQYQELLQIFEDTNSNDLVSAKEKGLALENLVSFIAIKTNLFEVIPNIRTSSNEIDLLLWAKPQSRPILSKIMSADLHNMIIECKNYSSKISVTWVGKVYSLLKYQKCKVGIIFSYNGFTGQNWTDAIGLSKKIYLLDGTSIIDFNISDFRKMAEGLNLMSILENKLINLKQDVKVEFSPHPAQKYI